MTLLGAIPAATDPEDPRMPMPSCSAVTFMGEGAAGEGRATPSSPAMADIFLVGRQRALAFCWRFGGGHGEMERSTRPFYMAETSNRIKPNTNKCRV